MEQRISAVTLAVADPAAASRFYQALGWSPSLENGEVAFFQAGGMVLALYADPGLATDSGLARSPRGSASISLSYNVRSREEVDEVLAAAEVAGGEVATPGHDAPWGGYTGYFTDPDGHPWEVAWNPGWPMDREGRVTLP